jgi:hypothetical protein
LIEDGRDFVGFEIAQGWLGPSLCRDAEHFRAVCGDGRFSISDEVEKAAKSSEPAIPRADRCVAIVFAVPKKREDLGFGEIRELELSDPSHLS